MEHCGKSDSGQVLRTQTDLDPNPNLDATPHTRAPTLTLTLVLRRAGSWGMTLIDVAGLGLESGLGLALSAVRFERRQLGLV